VVIVPIVAVSMSESDFDELETLQKEGLFSNRSEVVRQAVQKLQSEHQRLEHVEGIVTAVFTALYYKTGKGDGINKVQHEFTEYITATIHAHTTDGRCAEVMIMDAEAEVIRSFLKMLRSQKKVLRVDVNLIGGGK
jgi:CopG family nickel-responsive transcriptional regulator